MGALKEFEELAEEYTRLSVELDDMVSRQASLEEKIATGLPDFKEPRRNSLKLVSRQRAQLEKQLSSLDDKLVDLQKRDAGVPRSDDDMRMVALRSHLRELREEKAHLKVLERKAPSWPILGDARRRKIAELEEWCNFYVSKIRLIEREQDARAEEEPEIEG
jgi:hypothetical protein